MRNEIAVLFFVTLLMLFGGCKETAVAPPTDKDTKVDQTTKKERIVLPPVADDVSAERMRAMKQAMSEQLQSAPSTPATNVVPPVTLPTMTDDLGKALREAMRWFNSPSVSAKKVVETVELDQNKLEHFIYISIRNTAAEYEWVVLKRDPPVNLQREYVHRRCVVGGLRCELWLNPQSDTMYCHFMGYFSERTVQKDKLDGLRNRVKGQVSEWISSSEAVSERLVRHWPRGASRFQRFPNGLSSYNSSWWNRPRPFYWY